MTLKQLGELNPEVREYVIAKSYLITHEKEIASLKKELNIVEKMAESRRKQVAILDAKYMPSTLPEVKL